MGRTRNLTPLDIANKKAKEAGMTYAEYQVQETFKSLGDFRKNTKLKFKEQLVQKAKRRKKII